MRPLWNWLRGRFTADPIDEELAAHFELLREERLDAGDSPEQANRNARLRLGHSHAIRESVRALHLRHQLEYAALRIRFAFRSYRGNGGAYLLATAILALGIGIAAALFSIVDAVVLSPLPFSGEERVHLFWKSDAALQSHLVGELAYPELADLQSLPEVESAALFPAAPYGNGRTLETASGEAIQIESCPASPGFFQVLGMAPRAGRDFEPGDSAAGAAPVAVLSDWVWRTHFGGDPGVLNRMIRLNRRAHRVIGIMPAEFDFPRGIGLWVNLPAATKRDMNWLQAVVRSRPGVSTAALQAAAAHAVRLQVQNHPGQYPATQRAVVTPIRDFFAGPAKPQLFFALAAAILLLLCACASAATLVVSRTMARRREIDTRAALGATPGEIHALFLTESAFTSVLAALIGGIIAVVVIRLLAAMAPPDIPRIAGAALNARALAMVALASVIWVCGSAVALRGLGQTRLAKPGRLPQRFFLLLQSGLTVTILAVSAMVFLSFRAILRVDPGIAGASTLTVNLALRGPGITPDSYRRQYLEIIDALRANPGVSHAAGILLRPLEGSIGWDARYSLEFEDANRDPSATLPKANFEVVTPGYFDAIGTPILAGRDFTLHDRKDSPLAAIVSDSIARRFRAAGRNPIGERISVFDEMRVIVGVVADARFRGIRQVGQDIYLPFTQIDIPTNYLIVRGEASAAELLALLRQTVREVSPGQAIAGEATIADLLRRDTARDRFHLALLAVFALSAITLAVAGVLSVTREIVSLRAKELAIRVAIGATRSRVAAHVAKGILRWVSAGALLGVLGGAWLGAAARSLLFAVSPHDPGLLAAAAGLVIFTAAVFSLLPAFRAAGRVATGLLR